MTYARAEPGALEFSISRCYTRLPWKKSGIRGGKGGLTARKFLGGEVKNSQISEG